MWVFLLVIFRHHLTLENVPCTLENENEREKGVVSKAKAVVQVIPLRKALEDLQ